MEGKRVQPVWGTSLHPKLYMPPHPSLLQGMAMQASQGNAQRNILFLLRSAAAEAELAACQLLPA